MSAAAERWYTPFTNLVKNDVMLAFYYIKLQMGIGTVVVRPLAKSGTMNRYTDYHKDFVPSRDIREWLDDHCPGLWTAGMNRAGSINFKFARSSDAVLFKLSW